MLRRPKLSPPLKEVQHLEEGEEVIDGKIPEKNYFTSFICLR
jgi:hypothetical protein